MIDISITQNLKVLLYLQQSLSLPHFLSLLSLTLSFFFSFSNSKYHIIHFKLQTHKPFYFFVSTIAASKAMNQFSSEGLWWAQSAQPNTSPPPSSSKYKGVVPQPNGRWGAQIYENNHRLWLGTFDSQEAAAMSYDRAASMFRSSDATLNFHHHHQQHQSPSPHNSKDEMEVEEEETVEEEEDERVHMFEKPLTPSDVGKLNRLVIPKQHAEKYFPLGGSDSVEKGLLLSFEDEAGKVWRFRYSYWNSSQSYVLTKGWSRFVKEKQLDAGDVVWFERTRVDSQHLFIRWRRRVPPPPAAQDNQSVVMVKTASPSSSTNLQNQSNNSLNAWSHGYYPAAQAYPSHNHHLHGPLLYQPDCHHAAVKPTAIQNPTTVAGNSKRLRLFGVNLDCQLDEPAGPEDGSYDFLSNSQAQAHHFNNASSYNNYKELNFSRDQRGDD